MFQIIESLTCDVSYVSLSKDAISSIFGFLFKPLVNGNRGPVISTEDMFAVPSVP